MEQGMWVVFVHGFGSSDSTWASLKTALAKDPNLRGKIRIGPPFSYKTRFLRLPFLQRIPDIDDIADQFKGYLSKQVPSSALNGSPDLTLVGHSMGGLVIQRYLELCLTNGNTDELNRIRQVILFATPNFGSRIISGLRSLLSRIFKNPQEQALRLFSKRTCDTHKTIRELIIDAKQWGERQSVPIPFYCFWGDSDAVVPPTSAQGYFPNGHPLPGDHFSVLEATLSDTDTGSSSHKHIRYDDFVSVLLNPHGHPNIWEIERFTYSVKVSPHPSETPVTAKHGTISRTFTSDNMAEVIHQVEFSERNNCAEPYVLKYGTSREGWIRERVRPHPHKTTADKRALYENGGNLVWYEILPKELKHLPGSTGPSARMELDVYRGYDAERRDFHMHLQRKAYYRSLIFRLDLREYLKRGWTISVEPTLVFSPLEPETDNPDDHRQCLKQFEGLRGHITRDETGIWHWELLNKKEGMIGVRWDLFPPTPTAHIEQLGS